LLRPSGTFVRPLIHGSLSRPRVERGRGARLEPRSIPTAGRLVAKQTPRLHARRLVQTSARYPRIAAPHRLARGTASRRTGPVA
jgi:hypothetical protein